MAELRDAIDRALRDSSEARRDLIGHERLCTERWEQMRNGQEQDRKIRGEQHADNAARLTKLEHTLSRVKGGWGVIVWQTSVVLLLGVAVIKLWVN